MKQELSGQPGPDASEVAALLDRRTTVQDWLDRLDEQRGSVGDHILDRVRADYERRLRETLDALAAHRETVEAQLDKATKLMDEAQRAHADAVDRLEEGRLRNLIGELDHERWAAERARLEHEVAEKAEREAAASMETARLREILGQLEERAPAEERTPAEERAPAPKLEATPEEVSPPDRTSPEAASPPDRTSAVSPAPFLADIDRALSNSEGEATGGEATEESDLDQEPSSEDTAPKPGLKCSECGYTNDLSAWYCGVCGADVG